MQAKQRVREGSALVIVLGFLAVLLLLVFAFAVKMQTEYRTARSAEANVRTEFIMVQGIHLTAMEAGHPTITPSRSYWFYPRREVINGGPVSESPVLVGDDAEAFIANYLAWPVDLFIPQAVYTIAMSEAMATRYGILPTSFGGPIQDYWNACQEPGCGSPGPPFAQRYVATGFEPSGVAYVMLNGSGYLDVHVPYNSIARKYGTDPREIRFNDVLSGTFTHAGASTLGRVESMMELYAFRSTFGLGLDSDLSLFGPYSLGIKGQYCDTNNDSIVDAFALTGDVAYVQANATDIGNAFERAGFANPITMGTLTVPPIQLRAWLTSNLVDYADTDVRPSDCAAPCQEPVPAVNEIVVETALECEKQVVAGPPSVTNFIYRIRPRIHFELWNAYLNTAAPQVRFRLEYSNTTFTAVGTPAFPSASLGGLGFFDATMVVGPQSFRVLSPNAFPQRTATTNVFVSDVTYKIKLPTLLIKDTTLTEIYDDVAPSSFTFTHTFAAAPANNGDKVYASATNSIQCIDPRFNWNPSNLWVQCSGETTGRINKATMDYLTSPTNDTDYMPGDSITNATAMYCRNSLPLDTVGELGYLVVAPWRTVRLCQGTGVNQRVDSVVDTFTLDKPGKHVRGLVNPNTCFTGVLQAVFNESYMDLYPGEPAPPVGTRSNLSSQCAAVIARRILQQTYEMSDSATAAASTNGLRHGLLNLSDVGGITNLFGNTTVLNSLGVDCEFRREALVRNSIGLLSTRNVHYTAVLCATDEIDGGGSIDFNIRNVSRMAAEHKAIAMVWRDPWTKETFIRHFRYLPNDGALNLY